MEDLQDYVEWYSKSIKRFVVVQWIIVGCLTVSFVSSVFEDCFSGRIGDGIIACLWIVSINLTSIVWHRELKFLSTQANMYRRLANSYYKQSEREKRIRNAKTLEELIAIIQEDD